jgi:hypothetical protein
MSELRAFNDFMCEGSGRWDEALRNHCQDHVAPAAAGVDRSTSLTSRNTRPKQSPRAIFHTFALCRTFLLFPRHLRSFEQVPEFSQSTHHNPATMSSGEVLKADKDFSKEVDVAIPEAEKLGAVCATSSEADRS